MIEFSNPFCHRMLELAAKAAGYYLRHEQDGSITVWLDNGPDIMQWSPLTDDGDALRLAVKLNLRISIEAERAGVITVEWNSDGDGSALSDVEEYAPIGGDDYAATRRAIVRAAAEIGKAIP